MKEYQEVLLRKRLGLRVEDVSELLEAISIFGFTIDPERSGLPLPDESDRIFYDVAKSSNAYLITGNTKHYPTEPFILNPAQFMALLED
jgi:predicted nucleic acid-binding protein